jgi:hypothetical protein
VALFSFHDVHDVGVRSFLIKLLYIDFKVNCLVLFNSHVKVSFWSLRLYDTTSVTCKIHFLSLSPLNAHLNDTFRGIVLSTLATVYCSFFLQYCTGKGVYSLMFHLLSIGPHSREICCRDRASRTWADEQTGPHRQHLHIVHSPHMHVPISLIQRKGKKISISYVDGRPNKIHCPPWHTLTHGNKMHRPGISKH